jgi:soluble lytic murein transglycosylase
MPRNIFFFIKSLLLSSIIIIGNLYAAEISIIPLKKPTLIGESQSQKISQSILKPKSKPSKKVEKIETTIIKKEVKKITFLTPKSKPLVFKKSKSIVKAQSKY